MSKPDPKSAGTEPTRQDRAVNMIRAAGAATIVAGSLAVLSVILSAALAPSRAEPIAIALAVVTGIVLILLGVLTLREQTWCLWATTVVMGLILGIQLWMAYGSGRTPQGQSLSIFQLMVPLAVLIINTLAIGAARSLKSGS